MHVQPNLQSLIPAPITQSTCPLTSQTYFTLNLSQLYSKSISIPTSISFNNLYCKYCRSYYYPNKNVKKRIKKGQLKSGLDRIVQVECQMCGSIKDIKQIDMERFWDHLPLLQSDYQSIRFQQDVDHGNIQQHHHHNQNQLKHQIKFIFYFDYDILHINVFQHFSNVIIDFFTSKINLQTDQSTCNDFFQKQIYKIGIILNIQDHLFLVNLNNISTVGIESIINFQLDSSISIQQKKVQQNQNQKLFLGILNQSFLEINSITTLQNHFKLYMNLLIQEHYDKMLNRMFSFKNLQFYQRILHIIGNDLNILNNYVFVWITSGDFLPKQNTQLLNIHNKNIYKIVIYLYNESPQSEFGSKSISSNPSPLKLNTHLSLISSSNNIFYISSHKQYIQFYYKMYQLLKIVNFPKVFRFSYKFRSNGKYQQVSTLNKEYKYTFFIHDHQQIIIKAGHVNDHVIKFQMAITYQNYQQKKAIFLVNWRKDQHLQTSTIKKHIQSIDYRRRNHSQSLQLDIVQVSLQNSYLAYKQVYTILSKVINNLSHAKKLQTPKQNIYISSISLSLNKMIFQPLKSTQQNLLNPYILNLIYQFFKSFQNKMNKCRYYDGYKMLGLLASINNRRIVGRVFWPLVVTTKVVSLSRYVKILYWGQGYYVFCHQYKQYVLNQNEQTETQNQQPLTQLLYTQKQQPLTKNQLIQHQSEVAYIIDNIIDNLNQIDKKYYTRRYYKPQQSYFSQVSFKKLSLKQSKKQIIKVQVQVQESSNQQNHNN